MSPKLSKEQWLQIFLYTDETDVFFYFFPKQLYEWLTKLTDSEGTWRLKGPIVWTPELLGRLEAFERNITPAIYHWVECTFGSFVTYFMIDMNISNSKTERRIFKGP